MKILVVGAGGVGGYFGARLAAAGNEVVFAARGAHAEAMRRDGLRLRSPRGDLHLSPVALHESPARTGRVDLVLVTVKLYDLAGVADLIEPLLHADSLVLPFQNGIEAGEILARRLDGRGLVGGGVAYIGAGIEAPGVIRHTGQMARLVFGLPDGGRRGGQLEALLAACEAAGIDATLAGDITAELWKKFIFLAPYAGITCLARQPIGPVRADPALWARLVAMVEEAAALAAARGVDLPGDIVADRLALIRGLPPEMKSSMLQDLEAGRRLELDWLTGAIVRLGRESGVATPASGAVTADIEAMG